MTGHLTTIYLWAERSCLWLKWGSCKPPKLHPGYGSASCHAESRENSPVFENQDFFWQHKLVGGLFTLYICPMQCGQLGPGAEPVHPSDTTASQISDVHWPAVTTATAHWATQTSLNVQKGRIHHSSTFTAIGFCYFLQIRNTCTQELPGLLGFHHPHQTPAAPHTQIQPRHSNSVTTDPHQVVKS